MAAPHTQTDATLNLLIGGVERNCQLLEITAFDLPSWGEPTITRTACPDGITSEPGDPVPGKLAGTVFTDTTATGITWALADALEDNTVLTYSLTLWEDQGVGDAVEFTGTLRVAKLSLTWKPGATNKHPIELTLVTCTRARPA